MRFCLLVLFLSACGLQSAARPDGGSGGGSGGGTSGTGGGSTTGMGTYTAEPLTIDQPADAGRIMAISGPAANLYAASNFGSLYRSSDGARFDRVVAFGRDLLSVYVAPTGAVFVSGRGELGVCKAPPCTSSAAFTWSRPPANAIDTDYLALCGDAVNNVFAVGTTSAEAGVVTRYDGTAWSSEGNLGITNARACFLESSSVLWVAGMRQVAKWNGSFAQAEGADLTALGTLGSAQQWFSIFGVAGEVHAAGWSEAIMSRTSAGTWSLTLNNSSQTLALWFRTVAGLHANEVFAAGTPPSCTNCGNRVWRWNGSSWSAAPSLPVIGQVRSSHVVPPNFIYVGGQVDGPADTAAIVRLTRQ